MLCSSLNLPTLTTRRKMNSVKCVNYILTALQTLNLSAVTAAYRVVCEPRCGNPAIGFYNQCNVSQEVIDSLRGLCTRNNAGRFCYEQLSSMFTDINQAGADCASNSNCTTACQNALTTFGNNSGCCINTFNITTLTNTFPFTALQNSLWSVVALIHWESATWKLAH